jgi:uncharacterized protein
LLGDPQQLEQPQQGSHPEGSDISALAHLLDGRRTIRRTRPLSCRNLASSPCDLHLHIRAVLRRTTRPTLALSDRIFKHQHPSPERVLVCACRP